MATMKLGSKVEAFKLDGQTWTCTNDLVSDVIVEIEDMSFHLHKFPLLNRSSVLQKMISESKIEEGKPCMLQLHDLPGGAMAFELVAKFCYDVKIELNAHNIVPVRCAAEHLRMTEDYVAGNLITQAESFLNEVFGNWKDSMKVLETCEEVLSYAEELHIVARCINSLAAKACADPALFSWPVAERSSAVSPGGTCMWNGIVIEDKPSCLSSEWWYEDVCFLSLPLYRRLILAMESKGMKPEIIAGSLVHYARTFLPGLNRNSTFHEGASRITAGSSSSVPSESDQRTLLEELVSLLPPKKGVTSTKFLLGMLRTAMILHTSPACRENLEKRIGAQLDEAALEDLLIPNLGYSVETLYDIDCVQRILDHFMQKEQSSAVKSPDIVDEQELIESARLTPMTMVAKLIDGYLAEVAPDVHLSHTKFQSLAAVIPDYARTLSDGIYRAIDIYLKTHPWTQDTEKEQLCRLMNCQKLSLEACTHAAQNERLPLRVVVQVLFFEQLRLRTSIAGWFFVSDNMDNTNSNQGNVMVPRNNDRLGQIEITQEHNEPFDMEDMKLKVQELEKECLSMKQEIEKLGKPKSTWSILTRRFGLGSRSHYRC